MLQKYRMYILNKTIDYKRERTTRHRLKIGAWNINIAIIILLISILVTGCSTKDELDEYSDTGFSNAEGLLITISTEDGNSDYVSSNIDEVEDNQLELIGENENVKESVRFDVPASIIEQTSMQIEEYYELSCADFPEYAYSDWRIEKLEWAYSYDDLEGWPLDLYRVNYEFLSQEPEKVVFAGGMYMTEDNWICPTYPNCTYFVFCNTDDMPQLLLSLMENDCFPGDELFTSDLLQCLESIENILQ